MLPWILQESLQHCDKKEGSDVEQPLYIIYSESTESIKCRWCPAWEGALKMKVVNQHVRKSKSHSNARIMELNLPQTSQTGVQQMNIFDFT